MPLKPYAIAGFAMLGGVAVVEGARCCPCDAGAAKALTPPAPARTVDLHIEGMDCPACATSVRIALKKLDGVRDATVSYAEKRARVQYEADKVAPPQLVGAVTRLGYQATLAGAPLSGPARTP